MCFPQHQSLTVPLTSPSVQLVGIVRLRLRQLVGPIRPRQPFAANAIDRCANAVGAGFLRRLGFDDLKRRSRRRVQAEHGATALDNLCDQSSAVYVSRKGAIVKHGLQFVEPGELQSQRVLAGLLVDRGLRKAIEDLVYLGQSAGMPGTTMPMPLAFQLGKTVTPKSRMMWRTSDQWIEAASACKRGSRSVDPWTATR